MQIFGDNMAVSSCTYLYKPSAISRIQHKVNFYVEYTWFEIIIFSSFRLIAIPRLKSPVCPTIYP